jgi:Zn-dependent protease
MALVATALFFASILVHELSYTLRALREGVHVREITLWLSGSVSRAERPLPTPVAEFRVVAAGPLASAALALGFWGLAALARGRGLARGVVGVPDYLARINALLLIGFNAVPALPLDGGRIMHAVLWRPLRRPVERDQLCRGGWPGLRIHPHHHRPPRPAHRCRRRRDLARVPRLVPAAGRP